MIRRLGGTLRSRHTHEGSTDAMPHTTTTPLVRELGRRLASFHASLAPEERRLFEALLLIADNGSNDTIAFRAAAPA